MRNAGKITCDLCGAETDDAECWPPGSGYYSVNKVIIEWKTGELYPETRRGKTFMVDMCPKCFREKLVPWVESQRAKVREKDWSH